MRTVLLALSVTLIGTLAAALGALEPSLAKGKVAHRSKATIVQPRSQINPVPIPVAQPVLNAGSSTSTSNPDQPLCFLQQTGGSLVNLNRICGKKSGEGQMTTGDVRVSIGEVGAPSSAPDPAAERARQMEWNGGR